MSKVIIFSTKFPSYHPKAGKPTFFEEKIFASIYGVKTAYAPKHHTIRAGKRFKSGEIFSPIIWAGRPYHSPQLIITPRDIFIKSVFDFCIDPLSGDYLMDGHKLGYNTLQEISRNDGFDNLGDFELWFNVKRNSPGFTGQIICWSELINYNRLDSI